MSDIAMILIYDTYLTQAHLRALDTACAVRARLTKFTPPQVLYKNVLFSNLDILKFQFFIIGYTIILLIVYY